MAESASFQGFPQWGVTFYQELEVTNTKEFWAQHKAQWERDVKEPMLALTDALEDEFGPARLFRPNRDIRFSHDKSPYKTHQGAFVGVATGVGYYVQVSGDGLAVGGGFRAHSPAETARYRAAVDASSSGARLEQVAADLVAVDFSLEGETLKTRPKGFSADHPRLELLRRKEIMAIHRLGTPDWLGTSEVVDHVRTEWRQVRPLVEWMTQHVHE
jgi:uncharacterized protein (TIGR02453 family)